ncbi:MAG: hypothetical protein O3B21_12580 [Proteobacteria bacterium]|nr:hypothetical protein [Pseudomonadota bacterium]MDA1357610.1 hypothetical protein [Pseudomonadota bacterium]
MYKGMYTYAWDLNEEGVETVLERYRACGINTITLAASYHAGKFLRPHARKRRVYFPEDGTVYFLPRQERYGAIHPIMNSVLAEHDFFDELRVYAPDMKRVAWTVCLHNTELGIRHPEYAVRNAYGDPYHYNLCPAFEEVQEYVAILCADMAELYELDGIALETPGFLPYEHGFHHEFSLLPLNRWVKWLLGLCFSDASVAGAAAAGIDVAHLRQQTMTSIDHFFANAKAVPDETAFEWWIADLVTDPEWAAFLNWRCSVVTDLVARVRAAVPKETELVVIPTVQRPTAASWFEGSDLKRLAEVADVLEIPAYEPSAEAVAIDAGDVRRRVGPEAKLNFILRPTYPDLANGAETVAAAKVLKDAGASGLAFYNYGHMALASLDYVRDALKVFDPVSNDT